ncbi:GxxExxY protein [uncultured Imperialibacter sp.]|uniref:GxxExxY protein n=1 Tax=uncultured Imperialibacter sp. TaxID=1672639 RepID=UPI0030D80F84|tara:strand:+ start:15560 stop:15955 length:396 start_codon:yes stop_codon:yes gene_type:complete
MLNFDPLSQHEEEIGKAIINAAYNVHKALGPGLLEKVYEACMEHELKKAGYHVARQATIPVYYDGLVFDEGLRLDLLVEDLVIAELKAVDQLNPLWEAQIISHLRLTELNLGYLINFNVPLIKQGIKRFRN